jgi:glycosyltransferase involved in cell wall biosynthesis
MPVKDTQDTVLAATKSILSQTLSDIELIIIDDHSTDNSIKTINVIDDSRIKIITNSGAGIASALNTGLREAKGKYVARMDADDISFNTRLHKQINYLEDNHHIDVVSCLVEHHSIKAGKQDGYAHHINWLNSIITHQEHYVNRFVDAPVAHPTVFFRRELINKFGDYTLAPAPEDFELWLRWMESGVKFAKLTETLFQWSDYPDRASRVKSNYDLNNFFIQKAKYFTRWMKAKGLEKDVWIWGYGKDVYRKSDYLLKEGVIVKGYIDIKERPNATRNIINYQSVKTNDNRFILVYIGDRTGKEKIKDFLTAHNKLIGEDYLFMN